MFFEFSSDRTRLRSRLTAGRREPFGEPESRTCSSAASDSSSISNPIEWTRESTHTSPAPRADRPIHVILRAYLHPATPRNRVRLAPTAPRGILWALNEIRFRNLPRAPSRTRISGPRRPRIRPASRRRCFPGSEFHDRLGRRRARRSCWMLHRLMAAEVGRWTTRLGRYPGALRSCGCCSSRRITPADWWRAPLASRGLEPRLSATRLARPRRRSAKLQPVDDYRREPEPVASRMSR